MCSTANCCRSWKRRWRSASAARRGPRNREGAISQIAEGASEQYRDSQKLAARARLNREFTIAEIGWFPWVARQLPISPSDRVLDIGCGPGWFWASVAGELPETFALVLADQSAGMVDEATARCGELRSWSVQGHKADATQLPFQDASFDGVVAMHMIYHLADQARGIAEMFRVLKPGGWLAVTTNGAGNMREMYELTTALGSAPADPAGIAFGYDTAARLMNARFGNVAFAEHPSRLHATDPEVVFHALTSYPPGDGASDEQLVTFREAIDRAFERGGGALDAKKESALFLSWKSSTQRAGGEAAKVG